MSLYDQLQASNNPKKDFAKLFGAITREKNLLSRCAFELTPLCNFRCKFCYARVSPEELKERNICVMGFEEWKRYIDELAELNCLSLSLTGGECTLHPDFVRIYTYAYERGFVVSVFTNGSHITDEILDTFCRMPPSRIYLTMYGNTPETYEKVTGDGKYYEIVRENVRRLVEKKLDVILQGTFSEENLQDMEALYDFSAELGIQYRPTTQLQSYGHCTPEMIEDNHKNNALANQLNSNIALKKYGAPDESKGKITRRIFPTPADPKGKGIKCSAGRNSCFIRHDGVMMPCNTFDAFCVDTHGRSVKDCFAQVNAWVNEMERIKECEGCIHAHHCVSCVAAHYNGTGKLGVPSPLYCFKILEPEKAAAERAFYEEHGYIEL